MRLEEFGDEPEIGRRPWRRVLRRARIYGRRLFQRKCRMPKLIYERGPTGTVARNGWS